MKKLGLSIAAGLLLAAAVAPAAARPLAVTYWVELYYGQPSDGPANPPPKVVVRQMRAISVAAVETVCAHSLVRLSEDFRARDGSLQHYLSGVGGECVTDKSGKIKMIVDPAESK